MTLTSVAFLIAFLGGCILSLMRQPIYGLVTYIGVFYLHPPSAWWGAVFGGVRWSLIAAAITLASVWIHGRRLPAVNGFWKQGIPWLYTLLIVWLAIQFGWAMIPEKQSELLVLYLKYLVLLYVMYRILRTEYALRVFLWSHVAGCFYMGWTAFTAYTGGRFEGFRGPDIAEANAGALTLATGFFAIGVLFLAGKWRSRVGLAGVAPFLLDGLVRTASRGGFLALTLGGAVFALFAPARHRRMIYGLGALAVVVFVMLANPQFWGRIGTIKYLGAEVEATDTGSGRLRIILGQAQMFRDNPLGHGHRATPYLLPSYLPDLYWRPTEGLAESGASSHNTFMSLVSEQGVPGAIFYTALVTWTARRVLRLRTTLKGSDTFGEIVLAGVAAVVTAVFTGDMFVDYLKLEVRVWFIALLMVAGELWLRTDGEHRESPERRRESTGDSREPPGWREGHLRAI